MQEARGRWFESSHGNELTINSKNVNNMEKKNLCDDQEMRYILRQIGFGAVLGIAFLATLYIGGLLAQCVSNF